MMRWLPGSSSRPARTSRWRRRRRCSSVGPLHSPGSPPRWHCGYTGAEKAETETNTRPNTARSFMVDHPSEVLGRHAAPSSQFLLDKIGDGSSRTPRVVEGHSKHASPKPFSPPSLRGRQVRSPGRTKCLLFNSPGDSAHFRRGLGRCADGRIGRHRSRHLLAASPKQAPGCAPAGRSRP